MEQNPDEFKWLLKKIEGVGSILEIGSRFGDSLREMALVAKPGAKIYSIEHGQPSGDCPDPSAERIQETINNLRGLGYDAEVCLANSHDPKTLAWAKERAPFDFIFIDADHTYKGVKQDWEWYGPLGKLVGFHDIEFVGTNHGVIDLWREIRSERGTEQMALSGMGVGIVKSVA